MISILNISPLVPLRFQHITRKNVVIVLEQEETRVLLKYHDLPGYTLPLKQWVRLEFFTEYYERIE